MPELPELDVIKTILFEKIIGLEVKKVVVKKPMVFRCIIADLQKTLIGTHFTEIERRGKFLLFHTDRNKALVVNLMLAGRFQFVPAKDKLLSKTCLQIEFDNQTQLRYIDSKQMGRIYFESKADFKNIPQFADLGIEPLDEAFTYAVFKEKLSKHRGMIKNVITNQRFMAGIGNAYSDEILFQAGIFPLKKATQLAEGEKEALYMAIKAVLTTAKDQISQHIGDDIHIQRRDFMQVHNRGGMPCPVCGTQISELKPDGKATNFCRNCQK
jgi:formamidopyrimidine-DNA glycosylase